MIQARTNHCGLRDLSLLLTLLFSLTPGASPLLAQDAPQGPMAPPPNHHSVRICNEPEPPAPASLPEPEIIRRFSQKEDEYLAMRTHFTYKKTIRIEEFGPDGRPSGEYVLVTQPARAADGKFYEQVVQRPESTLQHFYLRSEDLDGLQRIPAFPLTTAQLANYNLKYLGKEQVDEVNCYIFQVKPKILERQKAHFDGVVWVDWQYVEVVKTYRENVQGKYWFPDYSRSDDTLDLKGQQIPVRIVIKWTDFKPLPAAPQVAAPAATPPAPASP